jgi:hypothetical protein
MCQNTLKIDATARIAAIKLWSSVMCQNTLKMDATARIPAIKLWSSRS